MKACMGKNLKIGMIVGCSGYDGMCNGNTVYTIESVLVNKGVNVFGRTKENQIIKQSFRLEETVMIAGMVAGIRL